MSICDMTKPPAQMTIVPAHETLTVAQFLKSENVSVLSHPSYSPDLAPCDVFLFFSEIGRRYRSRSAMGPAGHQFLLGVPKDEYENCFMHWIKILKRCVLAKGEHFKGS